MQRRIPSTVGLLIGVPARLRGPNRDKNSVLIITHLSRGSVGVPTPSETGLDPCCVDTTGPTLGRTGLLLVF